MPYDINSRNEVRLVGHVGQIDFVTLEKGRKAANLTLATNEGYTPEGKDPVEIAQWHRVSAYGPLAGRMEKLGIKTGSRLLVDGRLNYDDRRKEVDGVQHVYHNATVVVEGFLPLSPKEG